MADVHKKGLDAELVRDDLEGCCLKDRFCEQCKGEECTIGFAKQCIQNYFKEPKKEVPGGPGGIPAMDFKVFDETELETSIAHILKECKDCKEDHTEDCIINVIRNCYEVGLFGNVHAYEGSALQYVMCLKSEFPEKAALITELYMNREDVSD